jgi:outer membrane protein assembly factor BamA
LSGVFISLKAYSQDSDSLSKISHPDTILVISNISILGNKVTKEHIITRELNFQIGDSVLISDIEKKAKNSEENLMNTSLFNSVHITWMQQPGNKVEIYIILAERWYLFPVPIFEIIDRNFNVWWETKDFSRVVYGGAVTRNNFRGRNETVSLALRFGYTQSIGFGYTIPYINRGQRSGLSFGFSYARNHQIQVETYNNKLIYYKDESQYPREQLGASIEYKYRQGLYVTHYASIGYLQTDIGDTVAKLNPDFFGNGRTLQQMISLRYLYKSEHRDYVIYPLRGYEYDFEIVKNGLSVVKNEVDFSFLTTNIRKYWELASRWFFAAGFRGKLSDNNFQPYYNTAALGYGRDYVRGYEYYVVDGQRFALFKTNLKFVLVPKHELHTDIIPLEKFATIPYAFYINLYGDAAYAQDTQFSRYNPLTNSWLLGYGAGIDFVTYYDLVFRLEYSINRFGESGYFLHFTAPI